MAPKVQQKKDAVKKAAAVVAKPRGRPAKDKEVKKPPPRPVSVVVASKKAAPVKKATKTAAPIVIPEKILKKRTVEAACMPQRKRTLEPAFIVIPEKTPKKRTLEPACTPQTKRTLEPAFTPQAEKKHAPVRSCDDNHVTEDTTIMSKLLNLLKTAQEKEQSFILLMAEREDKVRVDSDERQNNLRRQVEAVQKQKEVEMKTLTTHYKAADELRQKEFLGEQERRVQVKLRLNQELRETMCGRAAIEGKLVAYKNLEDAQREEETSVITLFL